MVDLLNVARDIAKGCQYLEENQFIHRCPPVVDSFFAFLLTQSSCSIQVDCVKVGRPAGRSSRSSAGISPKRRERSGAGLSIVRATYGLSTPSAPTTREERTSAAAGRWAFFHGLCPRPPPPPRSSNVRYSGGGGRLAGNKRRAEERANPITHDTELLGVQAERSNWRN